MSDLQPPAKAAKNDAEWWAMYEIEALRKVEAAARQVVEECDGGRQAPALGSLAKLESALHESWRRRQPHHTTKGEP